MPRQQIRSHTGLRGIAALIVVAYHLQFGAEYRLAFETATQFFSRGYLLVDLFFVLSGFIISYSTGSDRGRTFSLREARQFFVARFARTYPLHIFCLSYLVLFQAAATLLMLMLGKAPPLDWMESAPSLILQVLLLHPWQTVWPIGWNIPSWSVATEFLAYALFPLLASWYAAGRALATAVLGAAAAAFYVSVALTSGDLDIVQGWALARCVAGFTLGTTLFYYRDVFARLADRELTILQLMSLAAAVSGLVWKTNDALLIPAFVLLIGSTWTDRGIVARALSARSLQRLGEISYSVYLNHVCVFKILVFFWAPAAARLEPHLSATVLRSAWLIVAIGAVILVSTATYTRVEKPAREAILAWARKRRAAVAAR